MVTMRMKKPAANAEAELQDLEGMIVDALVRACFNREVEMAERLFKVWIKLPHPAAAVVKVSVGG